MIRIRVFCRHLYETSYTEEFYDEPQAKTFLEALLEDTSRDDVEIEFFENIELSEFFP